MILFYNCYSKVFIICISALVFVLFWSCSEEKLYSKKIDFPDNRWSYSHPIKFNWIVKDTNLWYSMNLIIDHDAEMDYQNIYVKCLTTFPDSSVKEQIVSFELYTTSGKPLGQCGSSKCSTEIDLLPKIKFQFQGEYSLDLIQHGRDSIISGLRNMELTIYPFVK